MMLFVAAKLLVMIINELWANAMFSLSPMLDKGILGWKTSFGWIATME
jgi:hypothetical protein